MTRAESSETIQMRPATMLVTVPSVAFAPSISNYIAMEMAGVVAAMQHVRDRLHRLTKIGIPAVMGFSMALNALEFAAGATNTYELAAGIAMGVILPALVFLTFRVAAVLADV